MGADVTVVEMMDRVVPVEDADVSAFLEKALKKQGMTIMTGAGVEELIDVRDRRFGEDQGQGRQDRLRRIQPLSSSPSASSPIPRISGWRRWASNPTKGHIKTDGLCRTNVEGIWAIGDMSAPPWLAHKASHEGVIAAEAIAQALGNKDVHPHAMDVRNIPGCTYCHPQIASVGLTEAKAKEAGYKVKVGTFPLHRQRQGHRAGRGRRLHQDRVRREDRRAARRAHDRRGSDRDDPGLHVGKTLETTEAELMHTVFPHPTISESMHESVLAAYGRALHI
jgi:dihydrolipoamide dehydrogenase